MMMQPKGPVESCWCGLLITVNVGLWLESQQVVLCDESTSPCLSCTSLDLLLLLQRALPAIMSTSVQVEAIAERSHGAVGRCRCSFWFAVAHDILGVFIMMVGVFGGLVIHDLFIYAGAIIIFLSLIWWVFWYSGNIDVPPKELQDDVGLMKVKNGGLSRAVSRMSDRIRNSFRRKGRPGGEEHSGGHIPTISAPDMASSSTQNGTTTSSSKELVREPLSI